MSWPSRLSTTMSMMPCRSILKKEKKDRSKADSLRLSASEVFGVDKHHEKVSKLTLVTDMVGVVPTSATPVNETHTQCRIYVMFQR